MDNYLVQCCTVTSINWKCESLGGIFIESNFQYKKNMFEESTMYNFIKKNGL